MSTFKKVISIVLCFSLLAGSFAFLGDLIVPKASAAGTTNITKTYAELDAAYDNFIYLGIDVYEVKNDELTDGYVQAGDWLEYRMTILSDMYIGQSYPLVMYDRDFFDARVVTSMTPSESETYEKADYESNVEVDLYNTEHPSYEEGWITNKYTVCPCSSTTAYTNGTMGVDSAFYSNWDELKQVWTADTTSRNEALTMQTDTWWTKWYVRVRTDVKDGDTGVSQSRYDLYRAIVPYTTAEDGTCTTTDYKPSSGLAAKRADILTADWSDTVPKITACKNGYQRYSYINHLNLDDTVHTFTIGDAPSSDVEMKTATFLENDGSTITEYTKEYAPKDAVALPTEVADQYGWADTATGAIVALEDGFEMPEKNVTYKRVLTTDKFDITVNLDGGSVEDASLLPEGTTVNADGSVTIKAPINTEIDLNDALPAEALSKPGYKAAEWTDTAKIENINGLKVKLSWVADVFNVTFYNSEDDYKNSNVLYATTVEYEKRVGYADITKANTNKDSSVKFAGWADAETGEIVSTSATFAYTMTEDKSYYATWTDKAYTITLNIRDYENGGWKVFAAKYADNGSLALNDIKALAEAAGYIYYGPSATSDEFNRISDSIAFDANKEIYVFTKTSISVTWQVPVFDTETGEVTDSYTTETVTGETNALGDVAYKSNIKTTLSTAAHTGYKFVGWFDENGNEVSYNSSVGVTFNTVDGLERTITAKYELVEYSVNFNVNNGSIPDKYTIEGTFHIGDEIDFANASIINTKTGEKATLPTIGLENSEQPNGGYISASGYTFTGWQISMGGSNNNAELDISKPVTITKEMIIKSISNDTLTLYGTWEGEYYDLVFYYESGTDANGDPIYSELHSVKVKTGERLGAYLDEAEKAAKEKLPAGKTFVQWKRNGETAISTMPAYGAKMYPQYGLKSYIVYIDYNHSTEENPLTPDKTVAQYVAGGSVSYGFDLDYVPEATELVIDPRSYSETLKNSTIPNNYKPGDAYEVVGWKVYHVADGKDVYDKANWVEGVNDEGTSIAKSAIIYQVEWKAHSEFFFRIYDTDHGISRALGKDFKMYYWYNGFVRTKDTVGDLNKYPETHIILLFIPELENWDWSRFFDIDMWKSLTLKIEPFDINKSALNPKNFMLLLQALFKGIGSGFGSEEEVVE